MTVCRPIVSGFASVEIASRRAVGDLGILLLRVVQMFRYSGFPDVTAGFRRSGGR